MATVNYMRKELKLMLPQYELIRDCLDGEQQVKYRSTKYLPMPNSSDGSDENNSRYNAYRTRAVFYNATKRTLDGLCGQIFSRDPVIEVPDAMNVVLADANGSGVSVIQLSKKACRFGLGYGRAGIFVDYPETDGVASRADLDNGTVRPTLTLYDPAKIINWRTTTRGAKVILSMVVLEETEETLQDGFEVKEETVWRVLRLVNGIYSVEIWKRTSSNSAAFAPVRAYSPTDGAGKFFDEIPFTFVGSENNDSAIDAAPMYDIASLNIAHYRNSADYEESCFLVGQPTPVLSGLSEDWVNNVLKGKIMLGSRAAISLPVGGEAVLLQAGENAMPFEAMKHKEKQMVALGARLVEQRAVVRTASEATMDHTTESSILSSTAKNVSSAMTSALQWCARFMNIAPESVKFDLNTDFDIAKMSPEDRRQLLEDWQSGLITWAEARAALRKSGIATMDDADARDIIDEEMATLPNFKQDNAGANGNAA